MPTLARSGRLLNVCRHSILIAFLSPSQLKDAGIPYVILGHSERRTIFHETSEVVALKTRAALDAGLKVILCIGETLSQREGGETAKVCEEQLEAVVKQTKEADWRCVPCR